MLRKLTVMEDYHVFHGGKAYQPGHKMRGPQQIRLLDAFKTIQLACNYLLYSIDAVNATAISISRYFPPGHHRIFNFTIKAEGIERYVRAEKDNFMFTGDTNTIKPLLEYLCWFHNDKDPNPIPGSLIDTESRGPSWLPSLLLCTEVQMLNATEKKILGRYGVDDALLTKLNSMCSDWGRRGKQGWWLEIVAANELWFKMPQATFADMLKKHCL